MSENTRRCANCQEIATVFIWETNYCVAHYRIMQMRKGAKFGGKLVPSRTDIEGLVTSSGLHCQACNQKMNWLTKDGSASVVTLQHDHCGGIRLLCRRCNTRHRLHPNDSFYELPAGHKRCPKCETVKPIGDFSRNTSACLVCRRVICAEYMRNTRAARKQKSLAKVRQLGGAA